MQMMTFRNGLVAGLSIATLSIAAGPSFMPGATFKGSALDGWPGLEDTDWNAFNGEIIGTPKSAAGGCKTGIMMLERKSPGGMKSFLVCLSEGGVGLYRTTLHSQGYETGREKLRTAQ
jgi:hypothetical protein